MRDILYLAPIMTAEVAVVVAALAALLEFAIRWRRLAHSRVERFASLLEAAQTKRLTGHEAQE